MIAPGGRRHRRRFWRRLFLYSGVTVTCSLLIVAVYLSYVPITSEVLRNRIAYEFSRATNAHVKIASARYFVTDNRCELENLQFYETTKAQSPVLELKSARVSVYPFALLFGKPPYINRVDLTNPTPVTLAYDRHGLKLDEQASFLQKLFLNRDKSKKTVPFRVLRIHDANVTLVRADRGLLPDDTATTDTQDINLSGMTLTASSLADGLIMGEFSGMLKSGEIHSPAEGHVSIRPGGAMNLMLELSRLRVTEDTLKEAGAFYDARDLRFNLKLDRLPDSFQATGEILAASADISVPGAGVSVHDDDIAVTLNATYKTSTAALSVDPFRIRSSALEAQITGNTVLDGDHRFTASITASKIGSGYAALFQQFLPPGYQLRAKENSFSMNLLAGGEKGQLHNLAGRLAFTSLTLTSRHLPRNVEDLTGELSLEPGRILIKDISAEIGSSRFTVGGALDGDYLQNGNASLVINWSAAGSGADISTLAGSSTPDPSHRTGTFSSTGRLEQSIKAGSSEWSEPVISGDVELKDLTFSHPQLPAPVTGLSGKLDIEGDTARIRSLAGQMESNKLNVRGLIQGDRFFWRDPQATATVDCTFDIPALMKYLPPDLQEQAKPYEIAGRAQTVLNVSGPLASPEQFDFTGRVKLLSASFNPGLSFMTGRWEDVTGELSWDGDSLKLSNMIASINGERVNASGRLSSSDVSLTLKGDVELATIIKTFPTAERWMEMSGPARYDINFAVGSSRVSPVIPPTSGFGGKLLPTVMSAMEQINQSVAARTFSLQGEAVLGTAKSRARIRHKGMPPEKIDDQRDRIPAAEIRDILGRLVLEGDTLRIPADKPIECGFTGAKSGRLSGSMQFRPNNFPKIAFDIRIPGEAEFDAWLLGWGKGLPLPPSPQESNRTFELEGTITAGRGSYKAVPSGRVSTRLTFKAPQGKPRVTTFQSIRIEGEDGGVLDGTAEITSYPWDERNYPKWTFTARQIDRMRLLPLLIWSFKDAGTLEGVVTGNLQLQGVGKDARRITGSGAASLSNLAIGRTEIMRRLGQTTGHSFEGELFGTAQAAHFSIRDGMMSSNDLRLNTRGINLDMDGSYYFTDHSNGTPARHVNANMHMNFFGSLVERVPLPLVSELAGVLDKVAGTVLLSFQVTGPVANPRITPVAVPLLQGVDRLN